MLVTCMPIADLTDQALWLDMLPRLPALQSMVPELKQDMLSICCMYGEVGRQLVLSLTTLELWAMVSASESSWAIQRTGISNTEVVSMTSPKDLRLFLWMLNDLITWANKYNHV